jgi:pimeloyl-ACP methyl ester carboxylesterase
VSEESRLDVAVAGGALRVGLYGEGEPAVLGLHGVTANHLCWAPVARALGDGVRLVAPNLRGRAGSGSLPAPYGMAAHADDALAVLDAAGIDRAVVVGHSMGGFVALVLAHRHPDRIGALVLVDGGLPMPGPAEPPRTEASDQEAGSGRMARKADDEARALQVRGEQRGEAPPGAGDPGSFRPRTPADPDAALQAVIGPAARRLAMTFPTRSAHLDFWRAHPAMADWNDDLARYLDHDLVGEEPTLRSSASLEAVRADTVDLATGVALPEALGLLAEPDGPLGRVPFLRSEAGMLGEPPGLYPPELAASYAERFGALDVRTVAGVNHYTILLSPDGANAVAGTIGQSLAALPR